MLSIQNNISFSRILALTSLVIFLNLFLFKPLTPLAIGLELIGWLIFIITIYFNRSTFPRFRSPLIAIILWTTIQTLALFRVTGTGQIIALLSLFATIPITTYLLSSSIPFFRSLMELILSPLLVAFSYLKSALFILQSFLSRQSSPPISASTSNRQSLWKPTLVGLAFGIPIATILAAILTTADPIFAQFVNRIFAANILHQLPARLFWSLFIIGTALPLLILRCSSSFRSPLSWLYRFNLVHEATIVMTLVALVIGTFLIVQWPYVFVSVAKETQLSQFGVATYSEYVKKGFNELTLAAIFIFALIWLGLVILKKDPNKIKGKLLSYIQIIVLCQFFIFQTSILRRVWLYQNLHGWTLAKIYGGLFVLSLLCFTLTLTARHFWTKRWIILETLFFTGFTLFVTWFNAENFIVKSQHLPTVNNQIDYIYLSRLSPAGYEGWLKAYSWAKTILDNQDYLQKPILEEPDRRNIAYAGRIVAKLSQNLLELEETYATATEYHQLSQTLLELNPNLPKPTLTQIQFDSQSIPLWQVDTYGQWDFTSNNPSEDTKPTFFYSYSNLPHKKPYLGFTADSLTQIWHYNTTQIQARHSMLQDMPLAHLIKLQDKFFTLRQKITRQPPDQRSYETDVSFSSPFID